MLKISMAIDGSEHARRVFDKAVQLAASLDTAELHLVHVPDAPLSRSRRFLSRPDDPRLRPCRGRR